MVSETENGSCDITAWQGELGHLRQGEDDDKIGQNWFEPTHSRRFWRNKWNYYYIYLTHTICSVRYLGRSLIWSSGVPGHCDLSPGFHSHPFLLLQLLFLQYCTKKNVFYSSTTPVWCLRNISLELSDFRLMNIIWQSDRALKHKLLFLILLWFLKIISGKK